MGLTPEMQDMLDMLKAAMQPAAKKKSAKKGKVASSGRAKLTDEQKAANRAKEDAETIAVFTAKGYKDVQPRVNVRTYGNLEKGTGWLGAGRQVKKGEKSTRVGRWPLFHQNQTEEISAESGTVH